MSSQKKEMNFPKEGFKHRVTMDTEYGDKTWDILEHAIHQIYNHNTNDLSFEDLYRHACDMVVHQFGEKLYSGLVATTTSHLKEIAGSFEATQGSSFLDELIRKWIDHKKALQMIRDILMYMDRVYIPRTKKTHVFELGLNQWTENVIYSKQIRTRLSNTLLELLHRERSGEDVHRELIKNIKTMLMDLGSSVYAQEFETPFLQVSVKFYRAESQKFIECCNCSDYLRKVESLLNEENDRVCHYLDPSTEKKIINVIEKEMIENHMLRLIHMENSGLVNMLCGDKYEDLGRMYNLFGRITDGLSKIREVMTSHIRESVIKLATGPKRLKDPVEFVQRLLHEKDKYDKIINLVFCNDKSFENAFNSSFESFSEEYILV